MKRSTMNLMIAAAALAAVASSASAQILKAEIPFTFHAGNAVLSAGTYEVRMHNSSGQPIFILQDRDTGRSMVQPLSVAHDTPKDWQASGAPRLSFECDGSRCALREVWTGGKADTYRFNGPKAGRGGEMKLTEIRMTSKAD